MPIPKIQGESYVNKFLELRRDLLANFPAAGSVSDQTETYYRSENLSFVFTRDRIDQLFTGNGDANAIRIYFGAHTNGDPTIVLVPCQVSADDHAVNKLAGSDPVEQYPKPVGTIRTNLIGTIDFSSDNI